MESGFLNNEILRIFFYAENGKKYPLEEHCGGNSLHIVTEHRNETKGQYFRFVWQEHGYKIFPISCKPENPALTATENTVTLEREVSSSNQLWELLPYSADKPQGLLLKNLASEKFLSFSENRTCILSECPQGSRLILSSPKGWVRFGEAYLNHIGAQKTALPCDPLNNYFYNSRVGIDIKNNAEQFRGQTMLINQSGGNFPILNFNKVKMDGVCCEIMAAYNALTMAGAAPDFFRLTSEFEMNATKKILGIAKKGTWGSDPYKIADCLNAYGITYTQINGRQYGTYSDACNAFDYALKTCRCGIVSYNFPAFKGHFYIGIHTYSAVYDEACPEKPVRTFNRFSDFTGSAAYSSTHSALHCGNHPGHYLTGYVI